MKVIVLEKAAAADVARFVVDADVSLLAAAEQALANGVGEVLVTRKPGNVIGRMTLTSVRPRVADGSYVSARAGDALDDTSSGRLKAELDEAGQICAVVVDHSGNFLPVAEPFLGVGEFRNLIDSYLSGWISSQGGYIRDFERRFADYCGVDHGVAVANGTVAIHLALLALGVGPGDEVIVPDLTFAATINTVVMTGATPVIVDVDPDTWCMGPEAIRRSIRPQTRAIIPVHVFGRPAPMTEIRAIADEHGLYVIEDCAEAHGATYDGRRVGSFSHISTFSFFANKVITTGEGGVCLTGSPALAERMRVLRDHGMKPDRRYWHEEVGYNYRMTNMQAAIGCAQLDKIAGIIAKRYDVQRLYAEALSGLPGVAMPPTMSERAKPVTWFACATVPANARPKLIEACRKAKIDLRPFFNGLSSMPAYARWARPCPTSARLSQEGVNLPTSHLVDEAVVARVAAAFAEVLG